MVALTGQMFIGGGRVMGGAGSQHSVDPVTGNRWEPAYGMDDGSAVEEACRLAAAVFDSYRSVPDGQRAAFLRAIAANLEANRDDLVHCVRQETALAEPRVRTELTRTADQLRMFATLIGTPAWRDPRHVPAQPDRTPIPRPELRSRRIPVGPVAVFGASNFPLAFAVPGGDTASALAAGCPVIVKGHPAHLRTSEFTGACIAAAAAGTGMPDGVFSLVFGDGNGIGQQLVTDPRVAAVGFTGSRAGGLALLAAAQRRPVPIPVFAEMSSVNPVFLLPDRLAGQAARLAEGFLGSLTASAGQFCTNPGLVLAVEGPGLDEFRAAVRKGVAGTPPQPMLTAGIAAAYRDGVRRREAHAALDRIDGDGDGDGDGDPVGGGRSASLPAVFETAGRAFIADPSLQQEVFGAASILVVCADPAELLDAAESLEGQLSAAMQASPADTGLARRLLPILERKAGRIIYNGWPTGVEVSEAMVHGGPFPATSEARTSSVGTLAIERFLRPVSYQNLPFPL
jgi:2,5-dioxopentanoate dehydrogenase